MTEYLNLQLSKEALFTLDELLHRIDTDEHNNNIIMNCAKIAGVMRTIIKSNRSKGLIPP